MMEAVAALRPRRIAFLLLTLHQSAAGDHNKYFLSNKYFWRCVAEDVSGYDQTAYDVDTLSALCSGKPIQQYSNKVGVLCQLDPVTT